MISISHIQNKISTLESYKSVFIANYYITINELVDPEEIFAWFGSDMPEGMYLGTNRYDTTADTCLFKSIALTDALLTPSTQTWHKLILQDNKDQDSIYIQKELEKINNLIFAERYDPKSNFNTENLKLYYSLDKYGTGVMLIEDRGGSPFYRCIHISQFLFEEDDYGNVINAYRRYFMKPSAIRDRYNITDLDMSAKHYKVYHCVEKNYDTNRFDSITMLETGQVLHSGFYFDMPYIVVRNRQNINETYGRGPAVVLLPEIKAINKLSALFLDSAEFTFRPTFATKEEYQYLSLRAGSILPVMNDDGDYGIKQIPIEVNSRAFINDIKAPYVEKINNGFNAPLFDTFNADRERVTAEEIQQRKIEYAQQMGPVFTNLQSQYLYKETERLIGILSRAGKIKDFGRNINYKIIYSGPYNQARESEVATNILTMLQQLSSVAQFKPEVLNKIDFNKILYHLAKGNGAPMDILFDEEQMKNIDTEQQNSDKLKAIGDVAPNIADAVSKLQAMKQQQEGNYQA